jgi:hypothetical protein
MPLFFIALIYSAHFFTNPTPHKISSSHCRHVGIIKDGEKEDIKMGRTESWEDGNTLLSNTGAQDFEA